MLCPSLVGREGEVAELRTRVEELAAGRGGLVALVGEAGAGKSRLLGEVVALASERGVAVLRGRAVPSESPVAYRPISEALMAAFRDGPPPADLGLDGFRSQLARVVPPWGDGASVVEGDSQVLVGEAIVRLLRATAPDAGALVVLEDVHWADPETLAIVEHLADAARDEPVLCIATSRLEGAARDLVERLARNGAATRLAVAPLSPPDVHRMVAACLGVLNPPAGLGEFAHEHSDGNPFLVEELLAGLVSSGDLRCHDGVWEISELRTTVPVSLRQSIGQRIDDYDAPTRRVVGAAALLGREFDWELLPGVAEVDGQATVEALRVAVSDQLVDAVGDHFTFRHALTREAVLACLLPPERRDLARRAWPALELANPGLPGPSCELAADLAEAAGDLAAAGTRLIESARRALASGALATAEATARRARRLSATDPDVLLDADEALAEVLVAAGKPAEVLDIGSDLAARLQSSAAPAERQRQAFLLVGRAAVAAGQLARAAEAVAAARSIDDPTGTAAVDVLAAHVALDSGDLDVARSLAETGLAGAEDDRDTALMCDALIVLGRIERDRRGEGWVARFERAADLAERAGLRTWHLKARQELAVCVWLEGDTSLLHETRELATSYGALATAAVADLILADVALSAFDRDRCFEAATACVDASRRYHLATEPVAHLWLAGAHALAGDDQAMDQAIQAALAPDPEDPRILGDLYGRVLVTQAVVSDDYAVLSDLTEQMAEHVARAPEGTSVFPGRILRALLHTVNGTDIGPAARAELAEMARQHSIPTITHAADLVAAVEMGRQGEAEAATEAFEAAWVGLQQLPMGRGPALGYAPVFAPAAHRDGWGDPVRWLRTAEAFFAAAGYVRTARRCRIQLGELGAPMPRRGRGRKAVPEALRAAGVTSREVDVLELVVAGHTNKQIAEALVLSPKTVERHLSSLFGRFAVGRRAELIEATRPHLVPQNR